MSLKGRLKRELSKVYRKIEATEIEGGLRLLPDEEIELAFTFQATGIFTAHRDKDCLYFTNKRIIRLENATYRSIPYKSIVFYQAGAHGGDGLRPGATLDLFGEDAISSRLFLRLEEKYLIDVEYQLAKHILEDC